MKPLSGVRVLELARILAGPWTGQILADLGASVIKVERTEGGDDTRSWGPPFVTDPDGSQSAAYYHATNRGKRSLALDFEKPEDRATAQQLAKHADIIIENFKVGGLVKYGLDYAAVKSINPGVIYCSITGFGQTGPYAHRAGYDYIVQGMGGIMDLTGSPDGEPQKIGVALADILTGVYAAVATEAALIRRQVTGEGAFVDMALLDTQVSVLANQAMNYLVSGVPPTRLGNAHPNIVPYQVFPTRDGQIIIASGNDAHFARICTLLGLAELLADGKYARNESRVKQRDELIPILAKATSQWTSRELLDALEEIVVPAGPINRLDQVFQDPQVVERGMRCDVPRSDGSTVPSVRSPIVIDGTPCVANAASPALGEHSQEILRAIEAGTDPWLARS
jgi:crotonobetainyl-CoA:carnitine CoA-transferase CaiB-like acyl-CoA transferase